jgi:drug/metabolite transporter (DMT)-like permease
MSAPEKQLTVTSISLLLITVLFWGLAFPLIKMTLDFVPPLVIGYFRYFFSSLPFVCYILIKYDRSRIIADLKDGWQILIVLGITVVTIPNIAQNIGLLYTTSSIAALISTVAPVFTVIIAMLFLHESREMKKIIGLLIALTSSIFMIIYTGLEISNATLFGNILIFITSASYGISAIFSKIALKSFNPIIVTGFGMFFGAIILIPLSIIFNEPLDWFLHTESTGWWYLIILTFLPCMIATFLWYVVLQGHEVSKQILFTYLIPLFASIFAYILLDEILRPITIFLGLESLLPNWI